LYSFVFVALLLNRGLLICSNQWCK